MLGGGRARQPRSERGRYGGGLLPAWHGALIVFTGATSLTTRERMPRGEAVHRERALELGVPNSAVLVEPQARNTGENVRFPRGLLQEAGVDVSSVLISAGCIWNEIRQLVMRRSRDMAACGQLRASR
ncbi:hypothetical protein GT042_29805 [Streptomyces sp. SID3212]|nr:hypothetical protein [Streptomyces sp. SID3212]